MAGRSKDLSQRAFRQLVVALVVPIALALLAYVPVLVRLDVDLVLAPDYLRDEQDYSPYPIMGR